MPKKRSWQKPKNWVNEDPDVCPRCRQEDVQYDDFAERQNCGELIINARCCNCGAKWVERFTVAGYEKRE